MSHNQITVLFFFCFFSFWHSVHVFQHSFSYAFLSICFLLSAKRLQHFLALLSELYRGGMAKMAREGREVEEKNQANNKSG